MKTLLAVLTAATTLFGGAAFADNYEIDNAHTAAVFQISHLGTSTTHGRFNKISGSFDDTSITVEIDASTVDTNSAKRDKHLRGPDFFNVKQFPKMTFKSTAWAGDKVTGQLTIHGVTKEITIPVKTVGEGKDPWGGYRKGFETTFTIKRSDFDMKGMLPGIGDDVTITFAVEGIKKG